MFRLMCLTQTGRIIEVAVERSPVLLFDLAKLSNNITRRANVGRYWIERRHERAYNKKARRTIG